MLRTILAALMIAGFASPPAHAQSNAKILRVVPYADLQSLDPIVTTVGIVQSHAMLVYDFLFGRDENQVPQPQMVENWTTSDDGLVWNFTLRAGLAFHDGTPVTSDDVVASLKRWGARDPYGRQAFAATAELMSESATRFRWSFTRPYGLLLQGLSKSGGPVPAIMPKRIAETDPAKAITDPVGSGPFIFVREAWVAGSKVVYKRNESYVPRAEPASGTAGGKRAMVDRIEWLNIRDPQTAMLALSNGEVDYLENPSSDFLPMLRSAGFAILRTNKLGTQGILRMNHIHPPFNDVRARQALLYLVDQDSYLRTMFGDPEIWKICYAYFVCGGPLENATFPVVEVDDEEGADDDEGAVGAGHSTRRAVAALSSALTRIGTIARGLMIAPGRTTAAATNTAGGSPAARPAATSVDGDDTPLLRGHAPGDGEAGGAPAPTLFARLRAGSGSMGFTGHSGGGLGATPSAGSRYRAATALGADVLLPGMALHVVEVPTDGDADEEGVNGGGDTHGEGAGGGAGAGAGAGGNAGAARPSLRRATMSTLVAAPSEPVLVLRDGIIRLEEK